MRVTLAVRDATVRTVREGPDPDRIDATTAAIMTTLVMPAIRAPTR
jgi:hypothetical protein